MNVKELVQRAKVASPKLQSLPDDQAIVLVREIFKELSRELEATTRGAVKVGGLGTFRVRQVEKTKDGQTVRAKRTMFRAPKADRDE